MGFLWDPQSAGWWATAVWVPLVLWPTLAHRIMARHARSGRPSRAAQWARITAALHPADGWESLPLHLEATSRLAAGDRKGAARAMEEIARTGRGPAAREAQLQLLRLEDRWAELAETVAGWGSRALRDPNVAALYARALGEGGRVEEMLRIHSEHVEKHAAAASGRWVGHVRIVTAALAGRPDLVRRLLEATPQGLEGTTSLYWIATALQAAGEHAQAADLLQTLSVSPDPRSQAPAARRLAEPLAPVIPGEVPEAVERLVLGWAEASEEVAQHGSLARPPKGPPPVATRAILAALVGVFILEIWYGAVESTQALYQLGALVAPAPYLEGQWWRLVTGAFLHFNLAHILMNGLALWYFGRYVERILGARRMLALYALMAPASMGAIVLVATLRDAQPHVIVGASGAVMALLGITMALLWVRWRAGKAPVARRDLGLLLVMLGFQTAFDVMTPEVSFIGHASGVAMGFLAGWVAARGVS